MYSNVVAIQISTGEQGALVRTGHVRGAVGSIAETYVVAYHRFHDDGQAKDMIAGLRYVDRFERRGGDWRIARRVCAFEWRRTDPVASDGGGFADAYTRGVRGRDDIVRHILERPPTCRSTTKGQIDG